MGLIEQKLIRVLLIMSIIPIKKQMLLINYKVIICSQFKTNSDKYRDNYRFEMQNLNGADVNIVK